MEPFFSIITICYNSLNGLKKTCESVVTQKEYDYEYIVIDGDSNDGTVEYLKELEPVFLDKECHFCYVSESDSGIYQAMNKGIKRANGRFLIFMNAGDIFQKSNVLFEVKKLINEEDELVYGDAWFSRNGYVKECETGKLSQLPFRMPFSHQALFVRKDIMKKYMYNEAYRICGDREFLTRCCMDGCIFRKIECDVCIYDFEGISATNMIETATETYQIYKKLNIAWSLNRVRSLLLVIEAYILTGIRNAIPVKLLKLIRSFRFSHGAWKKSTDTLK